ncbi:lysine-specific demethylase 5A-like [Dorcoceras hygrometricum]|uniref:Lysine-specific demethylase 5A-like n=1 Tax=Dorcoceras hygrometricum TaxID=472368 RepID=A0A2Z7CKT3_9LAMI|nr:lysine-specific demethylase 5A-like [Dorcoceras hygrometricum]
MLEGTEARTTMILGCRMGGGKWKSKGRWIKATTLKLGLQKEINDFRIYEEKAIGTYIALILLSHTADLSIGGASPDTSSAPFDECSLVAGIRTHPPIPDARRPRGPRRGDRSSAELFGYINWRRLWE